MSSIGHMVEAVNTFYGMLRVHDRAQLGHHLVKVKSYVFVKSLEGSMEAEAEAVDGILEEVEGKEKFTAVTSLQWSYIIMSGCLVDWMAQ